MASRGVAGPIGDTDGDMHADGRDSMFARSGASSDHDTRLVQAMDRTSGKRTTSRHCGKGKALVVFAVAVLLATGIAVAIVFMDTTNPSPVFPAVRCSACQWRTALLTATSLAVVHAGI